MCDSGIMYPLNTEDQYQEWRCCILEWPGVFVDGISDAVARGQAGGYGVLGVKGQIFEVPVGSTRFSEVRCEIATSLYGAMKVRATKKGD